MSKEKEKEATASTTLATRGQWDGEDDGMDGLDESDLVVPRLHIVQQASSQRKEDGGEEGALFNALTRANVKSLRIIPLQIKAQRSNFPADAERPICTSDDGMVPSMRFGDPIHPVCCEIHGRRRVPVCPAAQWPDDGGMSDCRGYYELLAVDEASKVPFLISLRGMNVKPAKNLISNAKLQRLPLRASSCELKVSKATARGNTVYVVSFAAFSPVEGEDAAAVNEIYTALRGAVEATQQAEESVASTGGDDLDF